MKDEIKKIILQRVRYYNELSAMCSDLADDMIKIMDEIDEI